MFAGTLCPSTGLTEISGIDRNAVLIDNVFIKKNKWGWGDEQRHKLHPQILFSQDSDQSESM